VKRAPKTVGQRVLPSGSIQVFFNLNGFVSKTFPASSTVGERNAWRDREMEKRGAGKPDNGTFAADVETFLRKPEIAAMPSVKQYAAILHLWIAALGGTRPRCSITRDEIEAVIQTWLQSFAQPTVYHRRTVLLRMYTVLDGPDVPNPVKQTTRPRHYEPVDRSLDFATIERILDAMPAERRLMKGIATPSLAKLRAAVMAHTGIPAAELMKLKPHHFDRRARVIQMPWRDKGAGTPAHVRQLSDAGVAAFVALDAAQGWGAFAPERLSASFKRAARRVLGPSTAVRFYDLRHSLGAEIYALTRDEATVARMLGHAEGSKITGRYTMGAHAEVDRAAADQLNEARAKLSRNPVPATAPRLRKKLHEAPKLLETKGLA
jgi:integrase